MGLYNLIFGKNPDTNSILDALGLKQGDFGRFRDCYVTENTIAVYTRVGGGNRDDYEEVFERMRQHPNYLRNADDDLRDVEQAHTWWPCYEPKTTEGESRQLASIRLGCEPNQVEVKCTGGCVLTRRKKEKQDAEDH